MLDGYYGVSSFAGRFLAEQQNPLLSKNKHKRAFSSNNTRMTVDITSPKSMNSKFKKALKEKAEDFFAEHMTLEEKLIFVNDEMKKRYYINGGCILKYDRNLGSGDIIGESALFHNERSKYTYLANETVFTVTL